MGVMVEYQVVHGDHTGYPARIQTNGYLVAEAVIELYAVPAELAPQAGCAPQQSPPRWRSLHIKQRTVDEKLGLLIFDQPGAVQKIGVVGIKSREIPQQRPAVVAQSGKVIEQPLGVVT